MSGHKKTSDVTIIFTAYRITASLVRGLVSFISILGWKIQEFIGIQGLLSEGAISDPVIGIENVDV